MAGKAKQSSTEDKINSIQVVNTGLGESGLHLATTPDDDMRQKLAKKFVNFYFWILILIIAGVPAYNFLMYALTCNTALLISLKDAILTYSAVAGPTFGLVVAYYFKSKGN